MTVSVSVSSRNPLTFSGGEEGTKKINRVIRSVFVSVALEDYFTKVNCYPGSPL